MSVAVVTPTAMPKLLELQPEQGHGALAAPAHPSSIPAPGAANQPQQEEKAEAVLCLDL